MTGPKTLRESNLLFLALVRCSLRGSIPHSDHNIFVKVVATTTRRKRACVRVLLSCVATIRSP